MASVRTPSHWLLVERDMIVGLGLAEDLIDAGERVSGPFVSLRDVLLLLDQDPPDRAIMDLELRDGSGPTIARALRARDVPLVIFTALERRSPSAQEFADLPWVEKPAASERVIALLDPDLLASRSPPHRLALGAA